MNEAQFAMHIPDSLKSKLCVNLISTFPALISRLPSTHRLPPSQPFIIAHSSIFNNNSLQALALLLLDVYGLYVAVQLLLGALLVVAFPRDAYS
jgi:hypothetical protein